MSKPDRSSRLPRHSRDAQNLYQRFCEARKAIGTAHKEECQLQIRRRTLARDGKVEILCLNMSHYQGNQLPVVK